MSNEFYCRIESHFVEESETGHLTPKSTLSYLSTNNKEDKGMVQDRVTLLNLIKVFYCLSSN